MTGRNKYGVKGQCKEIKTLGIKSMKIMNVVKEKYDVMCR